MKDDKYRQDLDHIHAREEWKEATKQCLYQEYMQTQQAVDGNSTSLNEKKQHVIATRKNKRHDWKHWMSWGCSMATLSACVCLAVYVSLQKETEKKVPQATSLEDAIVEKRRSSMADLEKLPVELNTGSFGFGGYTVKDKEELVTANPWTEATSPTSLPVYRNQALRNAVGEFVSEGYTKEEMRAIAVGYVQRLNFTQESETIGEGEVKLLCREGSVEVVTNGNVRIEFQPQNAQSPTYFDTELITQAQANTTTTSIIQGLGDVLQFQNLTPDTTISYDFDGEPQWTLAAYEAKDDVKENIISYNFNQVRFSNWDEKLWFVDIKRPDITEIVGEYPIISLAQARVLLANFNYISSCPAPANIADIAYVELVYRVDEKDSVFMPYYKFYSQFKDTVYNNTDMPGYGAYYVPAVASQYLVELPKVSIHFN